MKNKKYKVVVYTSCSANYLPKALVLNETLKQHNEDSACIVCLCDHVQEDIPELSSFDEVWYPQSLDYEDDWIFKHNVMELCTAVKGRALAKLMREYDADLYLYLDPDVCIYGSVEPIHGMLEGASIGLTPHITEPEDTDIGVRLTELSVLEHGTYNLGHLLITKSESSLKFADWWAARLDQFCYDEKEFGLFTDQRWMDLVPALFDDVAIVKNTTLNLASWNFYQRQVSVDENGDFTVDGQPLISYHFSGTGPTGTHRFVRSHFVSDNYALSKIESLYESAIASYGQKRLENRTFGYDKFSNGKKITSSIRKLYRNNTDLQMAFSKPFDVFHSQSFFEWIKNERSDLLSYPCVREESLQRAFYELFDPEWYVLRYPDVGELIEQGVYENALDHYVKVGSKLLFDPALVFVSSYYYERAKFFDTNELQGKKGIESTLLWHYLSRGIENGIEPLEYFDSKWYLESHKSVGNLQKIGILSCALVHFKRHGMKGKLNPGADFDDAVVVANNAEVRSLLETGVAISGFHAYLILGRIGGRETVRGNIELTSVS